MKAMILAAGLGTRLLPYSLVRPKPLFPVCNRPLLLHTIDRLRDAGFQTIVINCHHLAEQIQGTLTGLDNIIVQHERDILGTGGGLRKALSHFGNEPVLVTNGDIYHTVDLKDIYKKHRAGRNDVTLVMHDYPRFNLVSVDQQSRVTGFDSLPNKAPDRLMAFTGIHVINPAVLQLIPAERHYSIIECYSRWLKQGNAIHALEVENIFWSDMGAPEDYLRLHGDILSANDKSGRNQSPFLVAETAQLGKNVHWQDWACIGQHASIGDNATVCRSVVWDGAVIKENEHVCDAIVT